MSKKLTVVIGLGGLRGSGKDTVADRLVEKFGFVKIGMSDPLANALYTLDPLIYYNGEAGTLNLNRKGEIVEVTHGLVTYQELIDSVGYTTAKVVPEVRRLLQVLGTEVGRNMIHDNVWVDIMRRRVRSYVDSGRHVVITGVRYFNELSALEALNAGLWWVDRPGIDSAGGDHSSETSLEKTRFHAVIDNNGNISDLHEKVDENFINHILMR